MKTEELIYNSMCKAFRLGQRNHELASSKDFTWEKSDKLLDEFFEIAENAKKLVSSHEEKQEAEIAIAGRKFSLSKTGDFIQDEKFDFDAGLKLSGDFVSEEQQRAYAKMIVDALNEAAKGATK
jgi:hypothetical protein